MTDGRLGLGLECLTVVHLASPETSKTVVPSAIVAGVLTDAARPGPNCCRAQEAGGREQAREAAGAAGGVRNSALGLHSYVSKDGCGDAALSKYWDTHN